MQFCRHVADFVEEQCSAVGLFEASAAQRLCTGERAFFVAEQLRFEQFSRDRSGIECDKRLVSTWAVAV